MKKIKILDDHKYIPFLGTFSPILTPLEVNDEQLDYLFARGFNIEFVTPNLIVPADGNKLLFTGNIKSSNELETESLEKTDTSISQIKYNKKKKK